MPLLYKVLKLIRNRKCSLKHYKTHQSKFQSYMRHMALLKYIFIFLFCTYTKKCKLYLYERKPFSPNLEMIYYVSCIILVYDIKIVQKCLVPQLHMHSAMFHEQSAPYSQSNRSLFLFTSLSIFGYSLSFTKLRSLSSPTAQYASAIANLYEYSHT